MGRNAGIFILHTYLSNRTVAVQDSSRHCYHRKDVISETLIFVGGRAKMSPYSEYSHGIFSDNDYISE